MSETRELLDRISSFRERLERSPQLVPAGQALDTYRPLVAQLAAHPEILSRSLRTLANVPSNDGPVPTVLTARARRLLEDARALVGRQRELGDEPLLQGLASAPGETDALVAHHRDTVDLTDAALKMVQAFPASAEAQLKLCDGLETMLRCVNDRLQVLHTAVALRSRDATRIDGLARRLTDLAAGRLVDLDWLARLAEELLDEARQAAPLRFLDVPPDSAAGYPGGPESPAPARSVAAHALTVARVVARVVPHDYEWAAQPLTAVVAALLMDLGMTALPAETLASSGPLDAAQRRSVEAHAHDGARRIANLYPDSAMTVDAIAAHHERPDGTGSPAGLRDDEIPSLAKLLAVCDAYAALCCERPHRPAKDPRAALTEVLLAAERGQFDREFAELLTHLGLYPVGSVVELSDGRVGVVAANHPNRVNVRASTRPVISLLADALGNVSARPETLDLGASDRGSIVRILPRAEREKLLARAYPELCG